MIYFIYGGKEKDIEVKKIVNDIKEKNKHIKEKYFDAAIGEDVDFMISASSNLLFGGKELLVLKRAEELKKPFEFFSDMKNYNLNSKEIVIDYFNEGKSISKKIQELFKTDKIIEIKNEKESTTILKYIKEKLNCNDKEALKIYEMKGYDIQAVLSETEKLETYFIESNFNFEEALKIISATPEYNLFEYVENLILNKNDSIAKTIDYLRIKKEYIQFLYVLSSNIRMYLKLKLYQENYNCKYTSNYNNYFQNIYPELKKYFNEHPYAIYKKLENLDKLNKNILIENLENIFYTEYNIKSGKINEKEAVEILIIKFAI